MASLAPFFATPRATYGIQRPTNPPPIRREVSVSPASSSSTLVEELPYSQYPNKLGDLRSNARTPDLSKSQRDSNPVSSQQCTPKASRFPNSKLHASPPKEVVTAATLLSSLIGSIPSLNSLETQPPPTPLQPRFQQQQESQFHAKPQPVNLTFQESLQSASQIDAPRNVWAPHFLAGIAPSLSISALQSLSVALITSCPPASWTPLAIASLSDAFAEYAFLQGPIVPEEGKRRDSAAPFALQLFSAIRDIVGVEKAALFTRELVERTVGVWFETWNPNHPRFIAFRKKAPSIDELRQQMNLSSFIGEMYKSRFISRIQFAECLATLLQDLTYIEQVVALRNLLRHAGKAYWHEEKLVSLGVIPAYPKEAMFPIPREDQIVVDVNGFVKELAEKVESMVNVVSLTGVRSLHSGIVHCASEIIKDVWRWRDEIEKEVVTKR